MSKVISDRTYQKLVNYLSCLNNQEAKELLDELKQPRTSHGSYILDATQANHYQVDA